MSDKKDKRARASEDEARQFAAAFMSFLNWVHTPVADEHRNEVTQFVQDYLGPDGKRQSVVTKQFSPFEQVNVQTAINEWSNRPGRSVDVQGIALPPHFGGVSLQQLVSGEALPPITLSAPALVDLPNGPSSTLACLRHALLLVTDDAGKYVLFINSADEGRPSLLLEVAGLPVADAQRILADLDEMRSRLNVYRGQVVEVGPSPMGGVSLHFAKLPTTPRDDVILPEAVLGRIERHALGVAEHRDALLAAGQHLKRGLLLYGPPGTGKTHTVRYLAVTMTGYTRLIMSGQALHIIGSMTELARELAPAVLVLEDVDLVAEDRSFGHGNPVLFELLNAMDGAAGDADLLFVLTTNRADLLEHALAARPGRVDVAVEIALPDADARRRLLALYTRGVPMEVSDDDVVSAVERMEGVTASFIKELVRRAVLESLREASPLRTVTGAHLARALDDLLDSAQGLTRTLLGVGVNPEDLPPGGGVGPYPAKMGFQGGVMYGGSYSRRRGFAGFASGSDVGISSYESTLDITIDDE